MKSPLIVEREDSKWLLLDQALAVTSSRRAKQEMAKHGITPVTNTGAILRLLLIAIFFSVENTYVIEELQNHEEPRRFAHIDRIPSADAVYRFLSRGLRRPVCRPDQRTPLDPVSAAPPAYLPH